MKRIENDCVDCGLPCRGNACRYRKVEHFYCDQCGDENVLYEYDGKELCSECLLDVVPKVEGSDINGKFRYRR